MKIMNRSRRNKFVAIQVDNLATVVPDHPPDEVVNHLNDIPQDAQDRIRMLFETRPIYTRAMLTALLTPDDRKIIKKLLPTIAYSVTQGAFRDCWIRYGYDPRSDPKSRFYQVADVRNWNTSKKQSRNKRAPRRMTTAPVMTADKPEVP
jgi:general transcription factor 3C polypeptide 5 (transcription factor C subunit 1)